MSKQVETFFKLIFGPSQTGYVCLATFSMESMFKEYYFEYPKHLDELVNTVEEFTPTHNVYFCPQLLKSKKRTKETVKVCTVAWADLDECHPSNLLVKPTIAIQTSPNRFQAYWAFEDPVVPIEGESISRRIAYFHIFQGADKSGWDLTQLLRVPFTYNLKFDEETPVIILDINTNKYRLNDFDAYPKIVRGVDEDEPLPPLPDISGEELLEKYLGRLPVYADHLFSNIPDGSWSEQLFNLEMTCFEASMSPAEVFIVARDSNCNKFQRDGLPDQHLWRDVQRAHTRYKENVNLLIPTEQQLTKLLTEDERLRIVGLTSFVDDYIKWASSLGDAAVQYHQAGAFTILSALLGGAVRLPTSFGTIKPNLWFMILADTTLTRKSTAMDLAMELIEEVDSSKILATDGSIEGLMNSLALRPGQPSIFLRDEFSGLLAAIAKKDYYAGMAEMFTKLYDGKLQKRVLKREIVEVRDPVLIMLAGGIKNKVCSLLTTEYISSGFLPRFVFITAESSIDNVRPVGPPLAKDTTGRDKILARIHEMHSHYHTEPKLIQRDGKLFHEAAQHWNAELTSAAWTRYNLLEADMMRSALSTDNPDIMTPTYDRLSKSGLKAAVLLAASENLVTNGATVIVTEAHILQAAALVEQWRGYTNDVVASIGVTQDEILYSKITNYVTRTPGVPRSKIMQQYHLTARTAEQLLATLEQRGLIMRNRRGKTELLYPVTSLGVKVDHVN